MAFAITAWNFFSCRAILEPGFDNAVFRFLGLSASVCAIWHKRRRIQVAAKKLETRYLNPDNRKAFFN
jgi:hypothetical protein